MTRTLQQIVNEQTSGQTTEQYKVSDIEVSNGIGMDLRLVALPILGMVVMAIVLIIVGLSI